MAVCLLCLQPAHIPAAEVDSPEAQEAMAKGLAAVKLEDYDLAIKYFKQSYEAGGDKGDTTFSLALAYDRAGGREFMAIAWYRIFLMESIEYIPGKDVAPVLDPRSEQVKQRIIELDIQLESSIRQLIKSMEEAVLSLAPTDRESYRFIAEAQAAIGDFDSARESLRKAIQSYHDRIYRVEEESQGRQGVIASEFTTSAMFIVLSQWKYGDSEGALQTINWALSHEPYRTPYTACACLQKLPFEELKMFINRDWKQLSQGRFSRSLVNEPFPILGVLGEKIYDGKIDSFLDPGEGEDQHRWYDLIRSAFVMYNSPYFVIGGTDMFNYGNISTLKSSCWQWRGAIVEIWPMVANCASIREFNKSWREMARERKSEYPQTTVEKTVILARDMAQVLYFFRKYHDYHSNHYGGYMW